jgi:A/G-specific adenine glycosylase
MPTHPFPAEKLRDWFRKNKRDLPWRRDRRPYSVWVSEIMLQQTRVDQAEGYYRRFMELFPDVGALAQAPLDQVLKVWEGLGYYSRALHLHQGARLVRQEHGGEIPSDYNRLIQIPGIGRSTAGAILSLAFNRPFPILDGNVKRVLSRFYHITRPLDQSETGKTLWQKAAAVLPEKKPGSFNEALMELGALICLPKDPGCARCPLRKGCQARIKGDATELPIKKPAKKIPHFDVTAAVIRKAGKILITRRPEKGLLGGLWEFPGGKQQPGETLEACLKREITEELAIEIMVGEPFLQVRHAYSHFKITLHTFFCRHRKGRIQKIGIQDYRWVKPEELNHYAFPRADRRVIERLTEHGPLPFRPRRG